MAHHRLGHADLARARFERAARWMQNHPDPYARRPGEPAAFGERRGGQLAAFRAEAEAVLAGPRDEPPGQRLRRSAVANSAGETDSTGWGGTSGPRHAEKTVAGNVPPMDKPPRRAVISIAPQRVHIG